MLPDVCASSGALAERLYQADISSKPSGWLRLLVLGGPAGIVAALVLSAVLRKTVTGYLPYSDEVQSVLRRLA